MPFAPLSSRDTQILSALFDPNADLLAAAAHVGLSKTDLIGWFAQSHR